jgi:UPF0271 protein
MSSIKKHIFVLDTSAILYGFNPQIVEGEHYITPKTLSEVHDEKLKMILEISISLGKLKIRSPKHETIEFIKNKATKSGDLISLSETDLEILALAYELKSEGLNPLVVSDDYSVQNLCTLLSLSFKPVITEGISQRFLWIIYCPACGKTYSASEEITNCKVCGHALKRKVYKKESI